MGNTLLNTRMDEMIIKRNGIKCSQCDETFPGGYDYRMHWEKHHLDYALKLNKENELRRIKETNN